MTPKTAYIAIGAAFIAFMLLGRYDVQAVPGGAAYLLDRWNGELTFVRQETASRVRPAKVEQPAAAAPDQDRWWEKYPRADAHGRLLSDEEVFGSKPAPASSR